MDRVISLKKMSMDSMIFENGENLSKGEKQKLIISRVLLRNSNILILDEALNGMEEAEEVEILKNINIDLAIGGGFNIVRVNKKEER